MTAILGTILAAKVTTGDTGTTFPVADAIEINGGLKSVADAAARTAIPTARLLAGDLCYQRDTTTYYKWDGAAWAVQSLGGGGAATSIDLSTATITNTLPSANSGALTGDVTKPAGSSATTIAADAVTSAKMSSPIVAGSIGGATAVPILTYDRAGRITAVSSVAPQMSYTGLPSLGIAISAWSIGTGVFEEAGHGGYYNGYLYIPSKTTNRVHKINSATGLVTVLTPSTLTFGARTRIVWYPTLAKFICFGGNGFITLDPTTDTFGSVVAPAGWGGFYGDYDDVNGFVYYPNGSRVSRCTIAGASVTDGGVFSGAASCVVVAGANVFVLENNNPSASKVRKYVTASWPTLNGTSLTLSGDGGYTAGIAYNTGTGKLYVAEIDGVFKVVDPTTVTVDSTVTLSGASGQNTRAIVIVAANSRAYIVDNAGKLWSINAATNAVVLGIVPSASVGETGFTYDTDRNILAAAAPGGTSLQRWYA